MLQFLQLLLADLITEKSQLKAPIVTSLVPIVGVNMKDHAPPPPSWGTSRDERPANDA